MHLTLSCIAYLVPKVGALPCALIRDGAADLLDGTLAVLEKHDYPVDPLTPKMHAMLANAVAHRPLLHEALGHLQQRTALAYGVRCALAPAAVARNLCSYQKTAVRACNA